MGHEDGFLAQNQMCASLKFMWEFFNFALMEGKGVIMEV